MWYDNSTRLITTTLKLALAERKPGEGLIFHSDQGTQYTVYAFRKLLEKHGITQSLSKPGTPYDNAVAESFFASFKKKGALPHQLPLGSGASQMYHRLHDLL